MTRHVPDQHALHRPLVVDGNGASELMQVYVYPSRPSGPTSTIAKADLKAALEQELGWTIISEPLPEVLDVPGLEGRSIRAGGMHADTRSGSLYSNPGHWWTVAREGAALARYFEQHPPVDPAVERLAGMLAENYDGQRDSWALLAEALIKRGVKVPE